MTKQAYIDDQLLFTLAFRDICPSDICCGQQRLEFPT